MDGESSATTAKIQDKDVRGLKYFDQLAPLLERLHDVGCERDVACNRTLHYDQYCMLILLFFFNPVVKSIRGLQQASELIHAPGIAYLGPLPPELQKTTVYAAGIPAGARQPAAAKALVETLTGPAGLSAIRHNGMDPG